MNIKTKDGTESVRMPEIRAFTLIELLVVISIIALLIAILLPVLGAARSTAQGVLCLTRERQVGLSAQMYADDHKEEYLVKLGTPPFSYWLQAQGYASASDVFFCPTLAPADVSGKQLSDTWVRPDGFTRPLYENTYAIRWAHPQYQSVGTYRYVGLTQVPQASTSAILMDTSNLGMYQLFRVAPDTSTFSQIDFRHQGAANVLFLDGHAAGSNLTDMRAMDIAETLYYWDGLTFQPL